MKFIGHPFRHNEFLTKIIEDTVLGMRGQGRPKKLYLEDINHLMQQDYVIV